MDFGGPGHAVRVVSLHPGVTFDEVQEATGFELIDAVVGETALPGPEELAIIASLDPHNIRQRYQGQSAQRGGQLTKGRELVEPLADRRNMKPTNPCFTRWWTASPGSR
jgi:hypothetical protein